MEAHQVGGLLVSQLAFLFLILAPKSINIAGSFSSGSTTPTKTATLRQNLTVSKVTGTTPVSASTSNAGAGMSGSLTDHQQFKVFFTTPEIKC